MLCCALPSLPHCVLTFHQAKWHRDAEGLIDLLRQSALLKPKYLQCFLAGFASAHFFFLFLFTVSVQQLLVGSDLFTQTCSGAVQKIRGVCLRLSPPFHAGAVSLEDGPPVLLH